MNLEGDHDRDRQEHDEEVLDERRVHAGDGGQRAAEAVEHEGVVDAREDGEDRDRGEGEEQEIGVGHRDQAPEHHRLDLVDVELLRRRDQKADPEPQGQRHEDADQRVRRQARAALDVDHDDRRREAEPEDARVRGVEGLAREQAEGEPGERRLPERGAEEGEAPRHDEVAHPPEQGSEQEDGDEAARHEGVAERVGEEPLAGERRQPRIEPVHHPAPSCSAASTSAGGPSPRTVQSIQVTVSARRRT